MQFSTADFVVGDLAKYPWGLMVVVWFAYCAPETLLGGIIDFMGMGSFGMFFAVIVVTRLPPIIGTLFSGRTVSPPTRVVRPMRPAPAPQQNSRVTHPAS